MRRIFDFFKKRRSKGPLDDFWYYPLESPTTAGVKVDESTAIKYLTVFSCVSLIADDIAALPFIVYRRFPDGSKERILDHPLYDILHTAPNDETTSFQWRESGLSHNLLWGNHYSLIERNNMNQITSLRPLSNPGAVKVERNGSGTMIYRWRDSTGAEKITPREDMLHIPGFGYNGLVGLSMIGIARESIGTGLATEEYGARFFSQGTHPSGTIELDGVLGDSRDEYMKRLAEGHRGLGKSHNFLVLEAGAKYKALSMPNNDAQFLESRNFNKIDICGFYHVPPHKIAIHGSNSNYNNLEQENQNYIDTCLKHWAVRWESAIKTQLFRPQERKQGLFAEFLFEGLLRGDSASRAEFYTKMWQIGAFSVNDILAKENMNAVEGGDQRFVPLNYAPLNQAGEFYEAKIVSEEPQQIEENSIKIIPEKRSIRVRDQISRQYYSIFVRSAERIINREAKAIKSQLKKRIGDRQNLSMEKWLIDFYTDLDTAIKREFGPVFESFLEAHLNESIDEINFNPGQDDIRQWINDYIKSYSERHAASSLGQLKHLLENMEEIETRVDEWRETRPEKIATNETVRGSNGIYQFVAWGAGLGTLWSIRGPTTCPYCRELEGRRVRSGESYVKAGDEIDPDGGTGPMRFFGVAAHPPLHQGCDCYLRIG